MQVKRHKWEQEMQTTKAQIRLLVSYYPASQRNKGRVAQSDLPSFWIFYVVWQSFLNLNRPLDLSVYSKKKNSNTKHMLWVLKRTFQ